MDEAPPKDLATRAFQKRVLDEFAALRAEQAAMHGDIVEIRTGVGELGARQTAIAENLAAIDQRLTSIAERVESRLEDNRSIWEAVQEQLQRLAEKFDIVIQELYEVRAEVKIHGRRIGKLERRAS